MPSSEMVARWGRPPRQARQVTIASGSPPLSNGPWENIPTSGSQNALGSLKRRGTPTAENDGPTAVGNRRVRQAMRGVRQAMQDREKLTVDDLAETEVRGLEDA